MKKKKFGVVLSATILLFVSMIAVVGIMCSYLLTYEPAGDNIPKETVVHIDENGESVIYRPGDDDSYNFLVLGHDRAATLTDVIMLVNYNVTDGSVSIMQFPRDTYVSYGVPTGKINASYSSFYYEALGNGSDTPELDALRKFADKIETALCTKISYCAIMNLDGFVNIVDAIGGVEMNVPTDMLYYDEYQDLYIDLKEGIQTLNGKQAEQFVRFRKGKNGYVQADLGRQDAQKIFMSAFIKKLQSSVTAKNITTLADTVLDNLYTDITVSDFVYFGKNMLKIDMSKITMVSVPTNPAKFDGIDYVIVTKSIMVDIVNEHFNVYDGEITEGIFDKTMTFATDESQECMNAYSSDTASAGGKEYNAENVNENSIDIPRM